MITQDALWPALKKYVCVDLYTRDGSPDCRFRLWLRKIPQLLLVEALKIQVPCLACGDVIHPVRCSDRGIYIAGSCPLALKIACARHPNVSKMYREIKRQMDEFADPDLPPEQLDFEL